MQATVQCRAAKCRTAKGGSLPASLRRHWKKKGLMIKIIQTLGKNLCGNFGLLTGKGVDILVNSFN